MAKGIAVIFCAVGVFLLSVFKIRYSMVANIALSYEIRIGSGCDLLISLIYLHNYGIIVADIDAIVGLEAVKSMPFPPGSLRFLLICVFAYKGKHAAVLISFVIVTAIASALGVVRYQGVVSMSPNVFSVVGQLNFADALFLYLFSIIISVMLINLFESYRTLIAVKVNPNLMRKEDIPTNKNRYMLTVPVPLQESLWVLRQ